MKRDQDDINFSKYEFTLFPMRNFDDEIDNLKYRRFFLKIMIDETTPEGGVNDKKKDDNLLGIEVNTIVASIQNMISKSKLEKVNFEFFRKDFFENEDDFKEEIASLEQTQKSDEGQWYINLWHRMNGASNYKVTLDGVENGTHDPKSNGVISGDNIKSPTNGLTENGKVLWTVLEDGLMNSDEWLNYALKNRVVTMERVNYTEPTEDGTGIKEYTWTSIIYSNALDISEEENSLSSQGPLSPPTNNKRIDSYFTPKEATRTDSKPGVSRNLFGSKSIIDNNSTQGMEVLPTPPQSNDVIPSSTNRIFIYSV